MQTCAVCRKSLKNFFPAKRRFCCVAHRSEARHQEAMALFEMWISRGLPPRQSDLRSALTSTAPHGARQYRLTCPERRMGGLRYYPRGQAWSLDPIELPQVHYQGHYGIVWYDTIGRFLATGGEVAIVSHVLIGSCPHDWRRDFSL